MVVILRQAGVCHEHKPMHFEAMTLSLAIDSHGQCDAVVATVDLALQHPN
ncbi:MULTISPECIES: hypothetical protein [Pseudomonas]|nr:MULTISPECIES: hypothetical protein [Pseudomonas]